MAKDYVDVIFRGKVDDLQAAFAKANLGQKKYLDSLKHINTESKKGEKQSKKSFGVLNAQIAQSIGGIMSLGKALEVVFKVAKKINQVKTDAVNVGLGEEKEYARIFQLTGMDENKTANIRKLADTVRIKQGLNAKQAVDLAFQLSSQDRGDDNNMSIYALAKHAGADPALVAKAVGKTRRAYGERKGAADPLGEVGTHKQAIGKLIRASALSEDMNLEQLVLALGKFMPSMAKLKVSDEEAYTAQSVVSGVVKNPEIAGMALARLNEGLLKKRKVLASHNFEWNDKKGYLQNLMGIKALNLDEDQLNQLFEARGLRAFNALTESGYNTYNSSLPQVQAENQMAMSGNGAWAGTMRHHKKYSGKKTRVEGQRQRKLILQRKASEVAAEYQIPIEMAEAKAEELWLAGKPVRGAIADFMIWATTVSGAEGTNALLGAQMASNIGADDLLGIDRNALNLYRAKKISNAQAKVENAEVVDKIIQKKDTVVAPRIIPINDQIKK